MEIIRAYRYRLYPTPEQNARLTGWQNALRYLWNTALEQYQSVARRPKWSRHGYPSFYSQCKELTEIRAELPFLADVPVQLCQRAIQDLETAWKRCWKGGGEVGAPKFKSKNRGDTVAMRTALSFALECPSEGNPGFLKFPKLGKIEAAVYRPMTGKPLLASLNLEVGEEWWVSIPCRQEIPDPPINTKPVVAIDRGVVNILADSNGRLVVNPRHARGDAPKIRRLQRKLRKQMSGSLNQRRNKNAIAKLHRRVRRKRDHILQAESAWYANNHSVIIVEKLGVRGMMKSAKGTVEEPGTNVRQKAGLNRALADSGMTRFVTLLRYKTIPKAASVREVWPQYSSQTCSKCGHVSAENRLSQDKFKCVSCGHEENADTNASKVLLSRGFSGEAGSGG